MPYMNQDHSVRTFLMGNERERYVFNERLRREATKALQQDTSQTTLHDLCSELSAIALDYADRGEVAHQALYFSRELLSRYPSTQHPQYDELVAAAWRHHASRPELASYLLFASGNIPFNH